MDDFDSGKLMEGLQERVQAILAMVGLGGGGGGGGGGGDDDDTDL